MQSALPSAVAEDLPSVVSAVAARLVLEADRAVGVDDGGTGIIIAVLEPWPSRRQYRRFTDDRSGSSGAIEVNLTADGANTTDLGIVAEFSTLKGGGYSLGNRLLWLNQRLRY